MNNFWSQEINEPSEGNPPITYIEEQINYLREQTGGKIIGRITEYEGEYENRYSEGTGIYSSSFIMNPTEMNIYGEAPKKEFDVQSVLGEQQRFVYEFYLTSKATPKYKYRVALLDYSISFYPAFVTLERVLAQELNIGERTEVKTEEEFVDLLKKMLSSKRVCNVVINLLAVQ